MDEKEFDRLLKISRINLNGAEKTKIKKDIEQILAYFDNVDSFKEVIKEPAFHPVDIESRTREDKEEKFE
ncbi:MAG: hypothetical protein OH316_00440, partial [Candidatus Parvarchaeota archaeon]|nr:hypothetical protein [Candidatus Parvarchaeota archaeon]